MAAFSNASKFPIRYGPSKIVRRERKPVTCSVRFDLVFSAFAGGLLTLLPVVMAFEYIKQPWKALYLAYQVPATLCVLPMWAVIYTLPIFRPLPGWSWGHAIRIAFFRRLNIINCSVGGLLPLPDHHAIVPSKEAQGIWIDGTPELITGDLKLWTTLSKVESTRIPGYWFGKKGIDPEPKTPVQAGERVFLFLHGGGYIVLSAHPQSPTSVIPRSLVELSGTVPHALAVEYRLSSTHPLPDRHPFPTALLDALAGYNYLVNVAGYHPSNIIVVGDSAGGNLALALVRYLVENKGATDVPLPSPPGGLILLSPWTDLSDSHDVPGSSSFTNKGDVFGDMRDKASVASYAKCAFLGPYGFGMAATNRYISPASLHPLANARFAGFPRTFIQAGGAERLLDQIRTLRKKMVADIGEDKVTYYEATDAIHDYLTFPWHPACPSTLEAIQQWLA